MIPNAMMVMFVKAPPVNMSTIEKTPSPMPVRRLKKSRIRSPSTKGIGMCAPMR